MNFDVYTHLFGELVIGNITQRADINIHWLNPQYSALSCSIQWNVLPM